MESVIDFLGRSVKSIKPDLATLTDDELLQVLAAEKEGDDRGSLISALNAEANRRTLNDEPPPADFGGKAARGEKTPAHHKADYSGPLTIEQALWRNQNIKTK